MKLSLVSVLFRDVVESHVHVINFSFTGGDGRPPAVAGSWQIDILSLWIHEQNGLAVHHQVEMVDRTHWRVHRDVGAAVDRLLLNQAAGDETRTFDAGGSVVVVADAEDGAVSSMAVAERCVGSFVLSIPIAQHAQSHGISLQL